MARYGQSFKDKAVARLLPSESASLAEVAREFRVSLQTLEKWRDAALLQPADSRAWTPVARFEALLTTAAMNEQERSAWCRAHGVFPQQIVQWRHSATEALGAPQSERSSPVHPKADRSRIKELERSGPWSLSTSSATTTAHDDIQPSVGTAPSISSKIINSVQR